MHDYDLCLWRLGHFEAAERLFDRMLWLNPSDNQGVCFLIDDARSGKVWQDREVKQKAEAAYKAMVEEFFDDEDYDENDKPLY
jgi:hypothetical protein